MIIDDEDFYLQPGGALTTKAKDAAKHMALH